MYKIKNWEKFNLYKAKNPRYQKKMTWFKFYGTDYINDIEIHKLSFEQKAVLVELWCLGSESDGILPDNFEIAFRLHYPVDFVDKIVKELFTRGWLEKDYQPVSIEKRIEREEKIYVVKTTDRFSEFWEIYPSTRKVNKKTCLERWANKKSSRFLSRRRPVCDAPRRSALNALAYSLRHREVTGIEMIVSEFIWVNLLV